jgi:hypothetical protein
MLTRRTFIKSTAAAAAICAVPLATAANGRTAPEQRFTAKYLRWTDPYGTEFYELQLHTLKGVTREISVIDRWTEHKTGDYPYGYMETLDVDSFSIDDILNGGRKLTITLKNGRVVKKGYRV